MSRLGVTVMPEWIQSEGVDQVLDNLERAGVNAVATSPYVMAESNAENAGREPPIDAGAGKFWTGRFGANANSAASQHPATSRIFRTIRTLLISRPSPLT